MTVCTNKNSDSVMNIAIDSFNKSESGVLFQLYILSATISDNRIVVYYWSYSGIYMKKYIWYQNRK